MSMWQWKSAGLGAVLLAGVALAVNQGCSRDAGAGAARAV